MSQVKPLPKSASDLNLTNLKDNKTQTKKWKKKGTVSKSGLKRIRTSKLSNLMEKSMNQDLEESETKDTSICSDDGFASHVSMIHLTIYLVIGNVAQSYSFLISNTTTVSSVITKTINEFNGQFASCKALFELNRNGSLYALKPSKKTGFPKTDMPFVNSNSPLSDINMNTFTLVWKEDASDYRSYFIKHKVPEKKACQGCIVI